MPLLANKSETVVVFSVYLIWCVEHKTIKDVGNPEMKTFS